MQDLTIWQMLLACLGLMAGIASIILGCALGALPFEAWKEYKKVQRERDQYLAMFLEKMQENNELREQLARHNGGPVPDSTPQTANDATSTAAAPPASSPEPGMGLSDAEKKRAYNEALITVEQDRRARLAREQRQS